MADLPSAAQKTVLEQKDNAHARLEQIEKVAEDGETRFDVELVKGKVDRSFSVSPEGKLISWQVFLREIPMAAQNGINAQVKLAKGELGDIDRVIEDEKVHYDVEVKKDGRTNSFSVSAEGKLLSEEITWAETPAPVQKTISAQAGDEVIKKIEKDFDEEDGEITYDVTIIKNGKKFSFSIDADGAFADSDN